MTPGEPLKVYRGDTDKYGNPNKAVAGTVRGEFAWGRYARVSGERGETSRTSVDLYVARGADLRKRDRVERANGDMFAVVGGPTWDQLDPFNGFDFGWVVYQLEAM